MINKLCTRISWLITVAAVWIIFEFEAGDIRLIILWPAILFISIYIYGLSLVTFGLSKTLRSVVGLKYLFIEKENSALELSKVYKCQINFSIVAAIIYTFIVIIGLLANSDIDGFKVVIPTIAYSILGLSFSVLISGLIYYPLCKKLS